MTTTRVIALSISFFLLSLPGRFLNQAIGAEIAYSEELATGEKIPKPQIFRSVRIKGGFSNYPNYKNWVVFITKAPSQNTSDEEMDREEKAVKKFPVSSDGMYDFTLKDVPSGIYYLMFGESSGYGGGRFTLDKDFIDMGIHEGDV